MAWVRIDDGFLDHPKFAKCGPPGVAMWLAGLAYCNRNLTDGFIPFAVADRLLSWTFHRSGNEMTVDYGWAMGGEHLTSRYVAELLMECGLWEMVDDGYRVHDYHDYQKSKEQVLNERSVTRVRVARWRCNGVTNVVSNGVSTVAPLPIPIPEKKNLEPTAYSSEPAKKARRSEPQVSELGEGEPVIDIPTNRLKSPVTIRASLVAEWEETYPGVDVAQTLKECRQWCLANPNKCKTANGMRRFINAWMAREQNKP